MLVRCADNLLNNLPAELQRFAYGYGPNGDTLPISIGKDYVVSAIQKNRYGEFYLVITDDSTLHAIPSWVPTQLFEVVDSYEPDDWQEKRYENSSLKAFKEFTDKAAEFDNDLKDGTPEAIRIFLKHYIKYAKHHKLPPYYR